MFVADLSSQSEVRSLAAEVLNQLSRVEVLVNNAGRYWATRHVTADGLERTFALNHLAPVLLTNVLLDRLETERPGPRRHGLIQPARYGPGRLRRPPGRSAPRRTAAYCGSSSES